MTDPRLTATLVELLLHAEEVSRLAEEIRRAADRIAKEQRAEKGPTND